MSLVLKHVLSILEPALQYIYGSQSTGDLVTHGSRTVSMVGLVWTFPLRVSVRPLLSIRTPGKLPCLSKHPTVPI